MAATYGRGVWQSPLAEAPALYPPGNFAGQRFLNQSFLQREYVDVLSWATNPANVDKHITQYLLYRVQDGSETLLFTANENTFQYMVRNVENLPYTYAISARDEEGHESLKTVIQVR